VVKQDRVNPEYEARLSLSAPSEPGLEYEYKNGFHDPSGAALVFRHTTRSVRVVSSN
jgi:hypothetical protein